MISFLLYSRQFRDLAVAPSFAVAPSATPANSVTSTGGHIYSTLSGVSPFGAIGSTCQNVYFTLPSGWILAPDDPDSLSVITDYDWSTNILIVGNGKGYGSKGYSMGAIFGMNLLLVSGSDFMPQSCPMQILMRQSNSM